MLDHFYGIFCRNNLVNIHPLECTFFFLLLKGEVADNFSKCMKLWIWVLQIHISSYYIKESFRGISRVKSLVKSFRNMGKMKPTSQSNIFFKWESCVKTVWELDNWDFWRSFVWLRIHSLIPINFTVIYMKCQKVVWLFLKS